MDFLEEIEATVPALRRFANALLGDRQAADELVQSSLERALSRRAQCRRDGTVKLWMFCVLLNRYRETLRRGRPRLQVVRAKSDDAGQSAWGHNGNLALGDVQDAIGRLPADQRVALLLVVLEGMNCEEVSQLLSIPRNTVMDRVARARTALQHMTGGVDLARSAS